MSPAEDCSNNRITRQHLKIYALLPSVVSIIKAHIGSPANLQEHPKNKPFWVEAARRATFCRLIVQFLTTFFLD